MIRYFFKLAFRNIRKYKVNTFISLLGLTVGLASFILIASYIKHELSFNKYNEYYNRIYSTKIDFKYGDKVETGINMPYPLVEGLLATYPEITDGVRLRQMYIQVTNDKVSFSENNGYYADNSFFEIFTADFLSGDKENALREPNSIVLTKSYAQKYFGDNNPIGKDLLIDESFSVKVTAVIDDFSVNSDLKYDFFISFSSFIRNNLDPDYMQNWSTQPMKTFLLLNENVDYEEFNEKLSEFLKPYNEKRERVLRICPLSEYHLNYDNSNLSKMLVIFGVVAIFILIIAGINFINLSIANAANRVKETCIRRIVGSKKSSLILQQIGESVLLSFISFDLAYLLAERLIPRFNAILQSDIPSSVILNFPFIVSMFAVAILLGLISGVFPAIKISKIQPLKAISGRETKIGETGFAKKGLVVFQYAVSIILIIASILMSRQFDYLKDKDLGFDANYLITCWVPEVDNSSNMELKSFRDEMFSLAGVKEITMSSSLPFFGNSYTGVRRETAPKEDDILINYNMTDISFLETFNIDLVMKKEFTTNNSNQEIGFCYINKTAVSKIGLENPIGEVIIIGDGKHEIVGVCNDYHTRSLQNKIKPEAIILNSVSNINAYDLYCWITIRCNAHNMSNIKEAANAKLKEILPDNPYSFFNYGDNDFKAGTLNKVKSVEKAFGFFTFIAIIIACMGIFGLVALTVKGKTKEVGIRKVLGSSAVEIFSLIAREYLVLALLGNIIAWYPAWYINHKILQDFAYRIDISLWVFVLGFISSILLTILTIAFHTIKAARTNPVEALRYE